MGEPAGKSSSVGSESSNELDSEEEFSGLAQLDEIALDNLQSEPAQDADASDSGDEIKANNVPEIQTEEISLSPAFLLSESDKLLDKCLPQFVDFLADFGSSESFLVDGDALIAHALENEFLDFRNGGHFLHLLYIVEMFLAQLRLLESEFDLFFHSENGTLFHSASGSSAALARQIVLQHLLQQSKKNPSLIKVHVVSGGWLDQCQQETQAKGQTWSELVNSFNPAFIMTTSSIKGDSWLSVAQRGFATQCLVQGRYLVCLETVEFSSARAKAFVLEPPLNLLVRVVMSKWVQNAQKAEDRAASCEICDTVEYFALPSVDSVLELGAKTESGASALVTAAALRSMLGTLSSPADRHFGAVLLAVCTVTAHLPLQLRAVCLPAISEFPGDWGTAALTFLRRAHAAMLQCWKTLDVGASTFDGVPVDLVDSRLFLGLVLVAASTRSGLALPSKSQTLASTFWTWATDGTCGSFTEAMQSPASGGDAQQWLELLYSCQQASSVSKEHANRIAHPATTYLHSQDPFLPDVLKQVENKIALSLAPALQEMSGEDRLASESPSTGTQGSSSLGGSTSFAAVNKFRKDHHFHSTKPICKDPDHLTVLQDKRKARTRTPAFSNGTSPSWNAAWKQKKGILRHKQKEAASAVKYAGSLLEGQPLERLVIPQEKMKASDLSDLRTKGTAALVLREQSRLRFGAAPSQAPSPASKKDAAKQKQGTAKKPSKKEEIQQRVTEDLKRKQTDEGLTKVAGTVRQYQPSRAALSIGGHETQVEQCVSKLRELHKQLPAGKSSLQALREVLNVLRTLPGNSTLRRRETFLAIQTILKEEQACLAGNEAAVKEVCTSASLVGFQALADKVSRLETVTGGEARKGSAKASLKSAPAPPSHTLGVSSIQFQLEEVPEHLARPRGVAGRDPRVPFQPDDWQVHLLDIVDSGNSALVVAPTASGKTFISFYVMEQCLRSSDSSVVVFVAPTKALVYQVYAEVRARYSKNYVGNNHLVGVFTRDHRENVLDCQILITVPACLNILLLSAENVEWASRIRHVIFDEVHCMGGGDGEVWEQLILMVHTPFLALSATLGDVAGFHEWMSKVEQTKGHRDRRVHLVHHSERYNDLFPLVFHPGRNELVAMHPLAVLRETIRQKAVLAFPDDLRLLPEHCVSTLAALTDLDEIPDQRKRELSPEHFFQSRNKEALWNISMSDVRAWELELVSEICKLSREAQELVIAKTSGATLDAFQATDEWLGSTDRSNREQLLGEKIEHLVQRLSDSQLLPALCFHMNRRGCERLVNVLVKTLERKEQAARLAENWAAKVSAAENELQMILHESYVFGPGQAYTTAEEALAARNTDVEAAMSRLARLKGVDKRFAFAASGRDVISDADIEDALSMSKGLRGDSAEQLKGMLRALRRGIGVHHSGLNKKVRQAVEHLVRIKKLALVFATGTLAMGINFPVKTSVLAGDAIYLNAMLFRQASGRAGRRGKDLRGHTVFFGISSGKIGRLVRARLPKLQGNVVLSPSTVLRVLMRLSIHKEAVSQAGCTPGKRKLEAQERLDAALQASARLVHMQRFSPLSSSKLRVEQTAYSFLFCLEFLHSQGLMMKDADGSCAPNDLSALIAHLYFLEPSNFAFLDVLRSGFLSTVCSSSGGEREGHGGRTGLGRTDGGRKGMDGGTEGMGNTGDLDARGAALVRMLSHLFHKRPLSTARARLLEANPGRGGPSKVLLGPPPTQLKHILKAAKDRAIETLHEYWQCFTVAYQEELGPDDCLPFTGLRIGPVRHEVPDHDHDDAGGVGGGSLGFEQIASITLHHRIRSLFVALSGHGDEFGSIAELCHTARAGLHIDQKMVPAFELDSKDYNSLFLDFYHHGQLKALCVYNGIKRDEVWDSLNEFHLTVKSLWAAMQRRANLGAGYYDAFADEDVLDTFKYVSDKYHVLLAAHAA